MQCSLISVCLCVFKVLGFLVLEAIFLYVNIWVYTVER
jgi:hypothetical protein